MSDPVDIVFLREELIRDEALRLKPYRDSMGKLSIGVGRNLDEVGISEDEARYLLDNDIQRAIADLDQLLPWWITMNEARRRALVNMAFNLGVSRLLGFKKALTALQEGEFALAADEFLDSKWAQQVGKRALRIANMIRGPA